MSKTIYVDGEAYEYAESLDEAIAMIEADTAKRVIPDPFSIFITLSPQAHRAMRGPSVRTYFWSWTGCPSRGPCSIRLFSPHVMNRQTVAMLSKPRRDGCPLFLYPHRLCAFADRGRNAEYDRIRFCPSVDPTNSRKAAVSLSISLSGARFT